ncbi:MAG: carboxymuconolactone decarboxylase family protein [Actinomycetota bacterium]
MARYQQLLDDLRTPTKELRRAAPDTMRAFTALHTAAMADGELTGALKECVALAISVAKHCDGCIAYHARGAARAGATREQVAECIGVAVLMEGGPATVYGPRAWEAFLEFEAQGEATS